MADSKISALPASTTPLAGTEVLPIVQSGATKQVSVANLTAGQAVSALSLTLTNALTAANGGTGQSSYAIGDLLYASGATALSKLADVATGNALISGGVGVAPSWGKINLATHVSGTLPIANGGTNTTSTPTAGGAVYGTGTAYAITSAGTSGQLLTSGGTGAPTWSSTPTVTSINSGSGTTLIANGATETIVTLSTAGVYLFVLRQTSPVNGGIRAAAFVMQGSSTNAASALFGVSCSLSTPGTGFTVQATNNAGGDSYFDWSYIRLL